MYKYFNNTLRKKSLNKHVLSVLEFLKIIELLTKYSATVIGAEIINRLEPENNLEKIVNAQKETSEMREIILFEGVPPFSRTEDIRDELKESKIGGTIIDPHKILKILKALQVSREVKKYFFKVQGKISIN